MSRCGWLLSIVLCAAASISATQCPWSQSVPRLRGSCFCTRNPVQELAIQCSQVDFATLLQAFQDFTLTETIDLLYVHNTSIPTLGDDSFTGLKISNIQISQCDIETIAPGAFSGLEHTLKSLNLQENRLKEVPVQALKPLSSLGLLDFSTNRINYIPNNAFSTLKLTTLKLANNNVTLADNALRGLENSLKNLNLKNAGFEGVPFAIRKLSALSFLDLAQNNIREIDEGIFKNLDSLAALNLERNAIEKLEENVFRDVSDTLSSISLLSNYLKEFPTESLSVLGKLRVLDIGFNFIEEIPSAAFEKLENLSLLAVDGNPLKTLPEKALKHLKNSLRGLSFGGKNFRCDCQIRWIVDWIRENDLQVTSRESNPQFCDYPDAMQTVDLNDIFSEDLVCEDDSPYTNSTTEVDRTSTTVLTSTVDASSTPSITTRIDQIDNSEDELDVVDIMSILTTAAQETLTSVPTTKETTTTPTTESSSTVELYESEETYQQQPSFTEPTRPSSKNPLYPTDQRIRPDNYASPFNPLQSTMRNNYDSATYNMDTNYRSPEFDSRELAMLNFRNVFIKDAYRQDSSVAIHWDSENPNILGFRVVYRLFGESFFQPGPPLEPTEREFKIKNVPYEENVIVCVVSLEDGPITPENVPYHQCREIRTEGSTSLHMDKIIMFASAAICGTVLLAVVIFLCCNRKKSKGSEKQRLREVLVPNSVTSGTASQSATLNTFGSLGMTAPQGVKDWDQLSMYSSRSIPRARSVMGTANSGYFTGDDARSHVAGYVLKQGGQMSRSRSMVNGHSPHRSASVMSGRLIPQGYGGQPGIPVGVGMNLGMVQPTPTTGQRPGSGKTFTAPTAGTTAHTTSADKSDAMTNPTTATTTTTDMQDPQLQMSFQRSQFATKSFRSPLERNASAEMSNLNTPDDDETLWKPYRGGSGFETGLMRHPSMSLETVGNSGNFRKSMRREKIDAERSSSSEQSTNGSRSDWSKRKSERKSSAVTDLVNL